MSSQNNPTYVILGSGGHTAEMCKITQALLAKNQKKHLYNPTRYVIAKSDTTSRKKIILSLADVGIHVDNSDFIEVPRSREVGQSWISTLFTTLWALIWSFYLVWRDQPKLILCNGPGTCVPFCISAFIWRLCRRLPSNTRIVFIESFCRVRSLSLSGRILLPIADMFVVQWQKLAELYKNKSNVIYFGRIM